MKSFLLNSSSNDVYFNIALEKTLLDQLPDNSIALMLWRNDNCVVIGKNQCAQVECNLQAMKQQGTKLSRRFSGGGAVYHDNNNLNFTFAASKGIYDVERQMRVVVDAIGSLGLNCVFSGRNDITIDGRKFSGNAFINGTHANVHHGTILIDTDMSMLSKCLVVNKAKLISNGVQSVVSRVVNLKQLDSSITCESVADALIKSFAAQYGQPQPINTQQLEADALKLAQMLSSEKWLLGNNIKLSTSISARLDWGVVNIEYNLRGSVISDIKLYSDALDAQAIEQAQAMLKGVDISAYEPQNQIQEDIIKLIKGGF